MNEICSMYKCIYKLKHHTQTPKYPEYSPVNLYGNRHIEMLVKLPKHLEKKRMNAMKLYKCLCILKVYFLKLLS